MEEAINQQAIIDGFRQMSEAIQPFVDALHELWERVVEAVSDLFNWLQATWQRKQLSSNLVDLGMPYPLSKFVADHIPKWLLPRLAFSK